MAAAALRAAFGLLQQSRPARHSSFFAVAVNLLARQIRDSALQKRLRSERAQNDSLPANFRPAFLATTARRTDFAGNGDAQ